MNRWLFGLSLFAVGFGMAIVGSSLTAKGERAMDRYEAEAPLLMYQEGALAGRAFCLDTRATVMRWGLSTSPGRIRRASFSPGHVSGVLTGLESPELAVSAMPPMMPTPGGPAPVCSVLSQGGYSNTCSTINLPSTECSVYASNAGGVCSTDTKGPAYCSAQNANGTITTNCSVLDSNTSASCSTQGNNNTGGLSCSTNTQNGGTNLKCSVSEGAQGNPSSCSTGSQAGPGNGGQAGTGCSAIGQAGGNFCSVSDSTGGIGNTCTADNTTNTFCSVSSGPGNSDWCSVDGNSSSGVKCTAIGTGTNANCSVQPGSGSKGYCSVKGGGGTVNGNICSIP